MEQMFSAGVVTYRIENGERLYLLLHYPHGHWDLPKGKIEQGETKLDAAIRELHEETGLQANVHPGFEEAISYALTDYQGIPAQKTVYFFVGQTDKKEVELSHEHQGSSWLPYSQAHAQLTYQNAQKVLQKAENFLNNLES